MIPYTPIDSERIFQTIRDLTELPGPTGQEEPVRAWLRDAWRSRMETWTEDPVGNIVCKVGGQGRKVIIVAHMDELGFVVRFIHPNGFLFLDPGPGDRLSSPDRRYVIGHTAHVLGRGGKLLTEGVFAAAGGHTLTRHQEEKPHLDYNDIFVDIGVGNRYDVVDLGIYVGAGVLCHTHTRRVGRHIVGKAMDDRMLLAIMTLMLEHLDTSTLQCELWFGATVQEENGIHGANALSHQMHFDAAIALDVGLVGDIPTTPEYEYPMRLGSGPTLVHKDRHIFYDERLLWELADAGKAAGVFCQHGVYSRYGSDAISFMDRGTPAVLVGVPTRYTHTPFEMIHEDDVVATVRLLQAFVMREGEGNG